MRESKRKMRKLIFRTRLGRATLFPELEATGWLHHIQQVLVAATRIAAQVASGVSCLVHCSDGWDRTPQITALVQMLLDPFYRTIDGFAVLVEKEWLSFGHKFTHRCGIGRAEYSECSPIFMQFLDCIWQISLQFPGAFEFNEDFLIDVADELYFCRCGTFLGNTERERLEQHLPDRTLSLWTLLAPKRAQYLNPVYSATAGSTGAIHPKADSRYVRLWKGYYCRWGIVGADQIGWGAKLSATQEYNDFMEAIAREEEAAAAARRIEEENAVEKEHKAIVLVAYEAQDETQLSLRVGQEVFVIEETNSRFWFVALDRQRTTIGYYPRSHLKPLADKPRAATVASASGQSAWVSASLPGAAKSPRPSLDTIGMSAVASCTDAGHHRTQQRSYLGTLLSRLGQSREVLQSIAQQEIPALVPVQAISHRAIERPPASTVQQPAPRKPLPQPQQLRKQQQQQRTRVAVSTDDVVPSGLVRRRSMSSALMPDECVARMAREMLSSHATKAIDDALAPKRRAKPIGMTWKEAKVVWGRKPLHPRLRRKRVRVQRVGKAPWPIKLSFRRHPPSRRQTDPGHPDGRLPPLIRAIVSAVDSIPLPSKPQRSAPMPSAIAAAAAAAAAAATATRNLSYKSTSMIDLSATASVAKSRSMAELPRPEGVTDDDDDELALPPSAVAAAAAPIAAAAATAVPSVALDLNDTPLPLPLPKPTAPLPVPSPRNAGTSPRTPRTMVSPSDQQTPRSKIPQPPSSPPPPVPAALPQPSPPTAAHRPAASATTSRLVRTLTTPPVGSAARPPLPASPAQLQQVQLRKTPPRQSPPLSAAAQQTQQPQQQQASGRAEITSSEPSESVSAIARKFAVSQPHSAQSQSQPQPQPQRPAHVASKSLSSAVHTTASPLKPLPRPTPPPHRQPQPSPQLKQTTSSPSPS